MKKFSIIVLTGILLFACKQKKVQEPVSEKEVVKKEEEPEKKKAVDISYTLISGKTWKVNNKKTDPLTKKYILAINRTDMANIGRIDSILIPSDSTADLKNYLPFPDEVPYLKDVRKIIIFSYPAQAFGAYENGALVYAGPTNMGRKNAKTPTGLYFANWKAKKTTSTVNDEWILKWNFNIQNKEGIGFHQYALPGYPASHSCLRLLEEDAKYLYTWTDQWMLQGTNKVLAKGTPVVVFGSYDFGGPKPWLQLRNDAHALDISAAIIEKETSAYLNEILSAQQQRSNVSLEENK